MIGRLLGIDHGLARIGLAVSDANGIVARELMVLERASKKKILPSSINWQKSMRS
jgi:RNase H-fold protein (predicted Holliday junction resolvase)